VDHWDGMNERSVMYTQYPVRTMYECVFVVVLMYLASFTL